MQKASPKEVIITKKSTQNNAKMVFIYKKPKRQPNPI